MAITRFPIKNVFSTGEVSPRFEGRSDVGKYYAALKRLINFLPFTQGGVTRRPGLRFGKNNFCDLEGRIIPFKFTRDVDSNFLVHLCDELLFITDDNGNEVPTDTICGETGFPLALVNDGNMDCNVATPTIVFTASGGKKPYTWGISGAPSDCITNMGTTISGTCNECFTITAPTNSGGGAGVLAHYNTARSQDPNDCLNDGTVCASVSFDCNEAFINTSGSDTFFCKCNPGVCPPAASAPVNNCANLPPVCCTTGGGCCGLPECVAGASDFLRLVNHLKANRNGITTDCRSAGQISAGCRPCSLCMGDALITVTDADLNMVSLAVTLLGNF